MNSRVALAALVVVAAFFVVLVFRVVGFDALTCLIAVIVCVREEPGKAVVDDTEGGAGVVVVLFVLVLMVPEAAVVTVLVVGGLEIVAVCGVMVGMLVRGGVVVTRRGTVLIAFGCDPSVAGHE